MQGLGELARRLRCAAFDFDGVFTDNAVYVHQSGCEMVRCTRSDGIGLSMLKDKGIKCVVVSTETNPVVAVRCKKLSIDCLQGCCDKAVALQQYLSVRSWDFAQCSFLGNDINDLHVMSKCGLPAAVADAHPAVVAAASWVGKCPGGHGAVREFCEEICAAF